MLATLVVECYLVGTFLTFAKASHELWRKPRNVDPGVSFFDDISHADLLQFRIQHEESRHCIESDGTSLKSAVCDDNNRNQLFKLNALAHNEGTLESVTHRKCVMHDPSSSTTYRLVSCNDASSRGHSMIFGCHIGKNEDGGEDMDWIGLRLKSSQICLKFDHESNVRLTACTKVKSKAEKLTVKGKPGLGLCAKAGHLGPRTNNSNYYYLQHNAFLMNYSPKYIRIYTVYSNSVFRAFVSKYGQAQARNKIREHLHDFINTMDKVYRRAKVRLLPTGLEIWDTGDKIPVATNSNELHKNFGDYQTKLRRAGGYFDLGLYYFDGDLYGAAGTASGNLCGGYFPFMIATVGGDDRTKARSIAHILTHEIAHTLNADHMWDPPNTCPTYHLFGARCTLGGNDWPKGFSSYEIAQLGKSEFNCLNSKPVQNKILDCGNGKIDAGEECDCGTSEACLLRDPCCDGSLCKLKVGAECSNEQCCTSCKYNRAGSCSGQTEHLKGDYGVFSSPQDANKNVYRTWRITTSPGTKAVAFFTLSVFDFEEGCPYDFLEIKDGGTASHKSLGKFCRTPKDLKVEGTTNELFVIFQTDSSYESFFKFVYSTHSPVKQDGVTRYYIRDQSNKCLTSLSGTNVIFNDQCNDPFMVTRTHHIQHVRSGKCIEPTTWDGHAFNGANLLLTGDCTSSGGKWGVVGSGKVMHGMSGLCLDIRHSIPVVATTCHTAESRLTFDASATGKPIPTPGPEVNGLQLKIRHSSGMCLSVNSKGELVFSSSCSTLFYLTSHYKLIEISTKKCFKPKADGDNNPLVRSSECGDNEKYGLTADGSIQQLNTGRCLHPLDGHSHPREGHLLVIYTGCGGDRLKFTLEAVNGKAVLPEGSVEVNGPALRIRHSSGTCLAVNRNEQIVFSRSCTTHFYLTNHHNLIEVSTKKCFKPAADGDNNALVRTSACGENEKYGSTPDGSIQQLNTGRCFHPLNAAANPAEGHLVVIYTGCGQKWLQFTLEKV